MLRTSARANNMALLPRKFFFSSSKKTKKKRFFFFSLLKVCVRVIEYVVRAVLLLPCSITSTRPPRTMPPKGKATGKATGKARARPRARPPRPRVKRRPALRPEKAGQGPTAADPAAPAFHSRYEGSCDPQGVQRGVVRWHHHQGLRQGPAGLRRVLRRRHGGSGAARGAQLPCEHATHHQRAE